MRNKYLLCAILLLALTSCGNKASEKKILEEIFSISENANWGECNTEEAIDRVCKVINDNPQSLDYKFEQWEEHTHQNDYHDLYNHIKIATSDDGNMRIFTFEACGFGGNPSLGMQCTWLIQYKADGKVFTKIVSDKASVAEEIHTLEARDHTYYLVIDRGGFIAQVEAFEETITAYEINDGNCNIVPRNIFKTKAGNLAQISISGVDYMVIDGEGHNSERHNIKLEEDRLLIPLVGNSGIVTEGYLEYIWNGRLYEYNGVKPIIEFETSKHLIRIDVSTDGTYQYKSWNKNRETNLPPDLIIKNGRMECWSELGTCSPDVGEEGIIGRRYIFNNNGYEYKIENGWWKGRRLGHLTISKDEKVLLEEPIKIVFSSKVVSE